MQFFFILRKKYRNVSTLHVIHHGIMPFSVWFGVKFTPGEYLKARVACVVAFAPAPRNAKWSLSPVEGLAG